MSNTTIGFHQSCSSMARSCCYPIFLSQSLVSFIVFSVEMTEMLDEFPS